MPATSNDEVLEDDRSAQPAASVIARAAGDAGSRDAAKKKAKAAKAAVEEERKQARKQAKADAPPGAKVLNGKGERKAKGHGDAKRDAGDAEAPTEPVTGRPASNGATALVEVPAPDEPAPGPGTDDPAPARGDKAPDPAPAEALERSQRARRRAEQREERLLRDSPAARRAELVAAAAAAATVATVAEEPVAGRARTREARILRRVVVFVAIVMVPASAAAMVVTRGPATPLPRADASFIGAQLVAADQRVRAGLARLNRHGTTPALERTRDAITTTRSLTLEIRGYSGGEAERMRRALTLEASWLEAVGSTLANPRSPRRRELAARNAAVRAALAALPTPAGRRRGGAQHLADYARARMRATGTGKRKG